MKKMRILIGTIMSDGFILVGLMGFEAGNNRGLEAMYRVIYKQLCVFPGMLSNGYCRLYRLHQFW